MGLHLYNTLTRRVEAFEPLAPPRVTMYTCGPTVWNYAHIGNFRTFAFEDLLRRYLEYSGYDVFQIMNLTDVDDRTIDAARQSGVSLREHTEPFVQAFFEDVEYLRIKPADVYPRATETVPPMIALVEVLLERGLAYRGDDGSVYYAVGAFENYGRLSQVERRELKAGARVASDEYGKEDARDFALWKAASDADEEVGAAWDAPFGRGRPGWHLECSAMALSELRARFGIETLDIHAGGVDLIFPHHENEIAQSEGATGAQFARYWLHGEFLAVEGTKMSKRYGNFLTPRDLRENGADPGALRHLFCGTHYRQRLNFSDERLRQAREGIVRLEGLRARLVDLAAGSSAEADRAPEVAALASDFREAMDDDLNAPRALAAVFDFARGANRALDGPGWTPGAAAAAIEVFDRVMGVLQILPDERSVDADLERWVVGLVERRQTARAARDFEAADAIRRELAEKGVELEDTPDGPRWRVRKP
jgi:cysteinyl-tRNA synthetase